ncbi:MAG: O-antigen ligase family protein [Bacteroidales bacterium]|nr:O-antigen ligase family protein [Bacteroidales bacterium]
MAPAVIILFVGLRFNSVAPFGYIPQTWNIYCWLIIIISILHNYIYKNRIYKFSSKQLLLVIFIFIIDTINLQPFTPFILFVIMLCVLYNSINNEISLNISMLSFIILALTLSIYYFAFAKEFMESYYGSDAERAVWVDPNYFGTLIGCGIILSFILLFTTKPNIVLKVIFILCIILSYIVVILQASRGATLSISVAIIVFLLLSKIKVYNKIFIAFIIIIGVIYLFNSGFFTLLIDRTLDDAGTGSGRTEIWISKFSDWSDNNINLIGCGYLSSIHSFIPYNLDCHNELLSTLINYGIISIVILIFSTFNIIKKTNNLTFNLPIIFFLFVTFMTLSPFSNQAGWIACPMLIVILYKYNILYKF